MLKPDLGDADIWMQEAEDMYLQSADASLAGQEYPATNRLNVAFVCAGLAFELLFKVLARAGGGDPPAVHHPSELYEVIEQLPDNRLVVLVGDILSKHGWDDVYVLLGFLDDLSNVNRKYWGVPRNGSGCKHATFSYSGREGLDSLQKMHRDLSRLALQEINEYNAMMGVREEWVGIDARLE